MESLALELHDLMTSDKQGQERALAIIFYAALCVCVLCADLRKHDGDARTPCVRMMGRNVK
jgi:hypothetical protein